MVLVVDVVAVAAVVGAAVVGATVVGAAVAGAAAAVAGARVARAVLTVVDAAVCSDRADDDALVWVVVDAAVVAVVTSVEAVADANG